MATADHTGTAAGVPAPAVQIARQLTDALHDLETLPVPGARELIVIRGITPSGTFTVPVENVVQQLIPLLAPAEGQPRLYRYGDAVMFAWGAPVPRPRSCRCATARMSRRPRPACWRT